MKNLRYYSMLAVLIGFTGAAHAQYDFPGATTTTTAPAAAPAAPWASFHLDPKVRVKLDFRNASVDAILSMLSQASGVAIVKDPTLTGGLTLQSPKPQAIGDALAMLQAVLNLKGFDLVKQGNFLLIQAKPKALVGGRGGFGAGGTGAGGSRTQNELRVYQIKYANATTLARVINDLYAVTASPFQLPGAAGAPTDTTGLGGQGGFGGFGGRGGRGGGAQPAEPAVKASADDYSNSLIVNGPARDQDQIADIIASIDKPTDVPQQSKVFKLQYAYASDLANVVNQILSGTTQTGRGGTSGTTNQGNNNGGRGGFGGGGGFGALVQRLAGGSSNTSGTVAADTRTNSLVVTTTSANMDHITDVIAELDKPATYETTTFVYVMKNARADVVANLLNQSFGNRTTNGPTGGSLTNTGVTQTTVSSGTSGTGTSGTTSGSPSSLGSGYTGGTRAGASGSGTVTSGSTGSSTMTTSIDDTGHIVNVHNLTNNVLLVPNIDTNSIIVVAPPEDHAIVENILKEMDQAPEQVVIETLVVEANLDKTDQFGVEFNLANGIAPTKGLGGSGTTSFGLLPNTTQPQGLRFTLTAGQYSAFLQAVNTSTKFNVLSTPRIFTTNNATAQINISQSLPYVTNQTVDAGLVINSFNFLDVGIVLTVTPRILDNGNVTMDVSQTANDFVGYTSFNAPIVNQRETNTTVSVQDGATVVLGGIIQDQVNDTVNKVPLLGDLPLLGGLFRSRSKTNNKTELLVFLTPHVIRNPAEAEALRKQTEGELGKGTQQLIPQAPTAPDTKPTTPPPAPSSSTPTTTTPTAPDTTAAPAPTPFAPAPAAATTPIPAPATAPALAPVP